jgi:hypothetical protein
LGTATEYDLRYSSTPIVSDADFNNAIPVAGLPSPRVAGTREQVTVRGLTWGADYWFALRTRDDAGNTSGISNVVRWNWVLDTAPPGAPTGLSATREGENVRLRWNNSPEPDLYGYRVYRALAQAGPYVLASGGVISDNEFLDGGVPDGVNKVWYEVSAQDQTGNESARTPTSVDLGNTTNATAAGLAVEDGYPNPSRVNNPVNIPVTAPSGGLTSVSVEILDSGNRRVRRMEIGSLPAGGQNIVWDGRNDAGRLCAPGVYRGWVIAGDTRESFRLVRVP